MYYAWSWWWLSSIIPLAVMFWLVFGWSERRYLYRYGERLHRDYDWDELMGWRYRSRGLQHRGRGPRNYRRSDARIHEDVNDRLLLSEEIDPTDVEVEVKSGTVILHGTVKSRFEKRLAEHVADSVSGVNDVENRLKIGEGGQTAPGVAYAAGDALPHSSV